MDSLTVVRGWLEWLEASGFAEHSRENYARPVTRFLMQVDHRNATLDDLVAFSLTQPRRSAHITYSGLRSFFAYAIAVGAIDVDPTSQLRSRAQPRTVPRSLTRDELERVRLAALEVDPRRAAAIDFLYGTGARTAEAIAVRPEDVTADVVILRKTKTRPGGLRQERVVPLSAPARRAVEIFEQAPSSSYAKQDGTLMRVGSKMVYAWVRDSGRDAGIDVRPHLLRATFATHLAEKGIDVRTIQDLLGHTNLTTTQRYVAVTDERRRAAVAALN